MKRYNVGLIGCGDIAQKSYLPNIANKFSNLKLYSVSDLNLERSNAYAQVYNILSQTTEEMLADPQVDIVVNLTNPAYHARIDEQILCAGKLLYSEKPAAVNEKEIARLQNAIKLSGNWASCAPDTLLSNAIQSAKKAVSSGLIGRVTAAFASRLYTGPDLWHPNPAFLYQKEMGPMMDIGIYPLAALTYIIGFPIKKVFCSCPPRQAQRAIHGQAISCEADTTCQAIFRLENECTLSLNVGWDAHLPAKHLPIMIQGTLGTLLIPDPDTFDGETVLYTDNKGIIETSTLPSLYTLRGNLRGIGVSELAWAVENDTFQIADMTFALHIADALIKCRSSAEKGMMLPVEHLCQIPPCADSLFLKTLEP